MSIWDRIISVFGGKQEKPTSVQVAIGTSTNPIYQYDVRRSTRSRAAIQLMADECAKITIRHIVEKDGVTTDKTSPLNKVFSSRPNEFMSWYDMISWTVWKMVTTGNCYWLPEYITKIMGDGSTKKELVGFFPIDSVGEEMYFDDKTKKYYITIRLPDGSQYMFEYSTIIHLRKNLTNKNTYFGVVDDTDVIKMIATLDIMNDFIPRALKAGLSISGVLSSNTMADESELEKAKQQFERLAESQTYGVVIMNKSATFTNASPKDVKIDAQVMEFIEKGIFYEYSVNERLLTSSGTEDDWDSFYQKNVEPFEIKLEQALSMALFSDNERNFGNKIRCYDQKVNHLSMKTKMQMIQIVGPRGTLTHNETRELLGYEPNTGPEMVKADYINEQSKPIKQINDGDDDKK